MSSVPMMGSGNIAGLSLLGCSAESRIQEPATSESETCNVPAEHADASTASESAPQNLEAATGCDSLCHDGRSQSEAQLTQPKKNGSSDVEFSEINGTSHHKEASTTHSNAIQDGAVIENSNGIQSGEIVKLHRIREVREQQGLSVRSLARRLNMDVKSYRALEDPRHNLSLSELHAVQVALDVPFVDLLEDRHGLSRPVQERAKLVKVMKSAAAIRDAKSNPRVQRLAHMLCEQLADLMPELAEVSGWPQFGSRRGQSALGRALREPIDTSHLGLSE